MRNVSSDGTILTHILHICMQMQVVSFTKRKGNRAGRVWFLVLVCISQSFVSTGRRNGHFSGVGDAEKGARERRSGGFYATFMNVPFFCVRLLLYGKHEYMKSVVVNYDVLWTSRYAVKVIVFM